MVQVVRIQKRHVFAAGFPQPVVPGPGRAAVALAEDPDPAGVAGQPFGRIVGRAVIDDDHLDWRVGLGEHAFDRLHNIAALLYVGVMTLTSFCRAMPGSRKCYPVIASNRSALTVACLEVTRLRASRAESFALKSTLFQHDAHAGPGNGRRS